MKKLYRKLPFRIRWAIQTKFNEIGFVTLLLFFWLLHVLFFGWFQYFFRAEGYLIEARDIEEDIENRGPKWGNRHHCDAARKAAAMNDAKDLVMFTWRVHPFFLDNDIMYIKSKGFSARIWNEREKIYHFR